MFFRKRVVSRILSIMLIFALLPFTVSAENSQLEKDSVKRDVVLMLDVSDSMKGTPFTAMKESAVKFCQDLF